MVGAEGEKIGERVVKKGMENKVKLDTRACGYRRE